jgi:hypothetical protein
VRNFLKISTMETGPLQLELMRQPQAWGQRRFREEFPGSPHVDVDDIWLRFHQDPNEVDAKISGLELVWYPEILLFPSVMSLVLPLLVYTKSWTVERLILTRLAPGGRILPHSDDQGAYVTQADINRYHIVIQGLPGNLFQCGEETVQMLTGEVWWFNPYVEHNCLNNSTDDRIHLLVDLRGWPNGTTPIAQLVH